MPLHRIKIATLAAFALSIFAMPNIALADDTGLSFDPPLVNPLILPAKYDVKFSPNKKLPAADGFTEIPSYSLTAAINGEDGMLNDGCSQQLCRDLPDGLNFAFGAAARLLSGWPTKDAEGTYTMTYTASGNGADTGKVLTRTFTLTVAPNEAPVFDATEKGALQESYNHLVGKTIPNLLLPFADGGEGDLVYSMTTTAGATANIDTTPAENNRTNSTPKGLRFAYNPSAYRWELSGTPTEADTYTLTYAVNDSDNDPMSAVSRRNTDPLDTAKIEFTMVVETDRPPMLTEPPATPYPGLKDRPLMQIDLPEADDGNFGLTDSLTGSYTSFAAGATKRTVKVDTTNSATLGAISLMDDNTPTGLTFTNRTDDGEGNVATITGSPLVAGTFVLKYKVVDGDSNELDCMSVSTPSGCDTATATVTLTVEVPMITLAEDKVGVVADLEDVVLKKGSVSTVITLPTVGGDVSAPGNISYALTAIHAVDSNGGTPENAAAVPVTVGTLPGLTYTEPSGSAAGTLAGTPTAAGIWVLDYKATDGNGTPTGDDDATASIDFTVQVVTDVDLALDVGRKDELSIATFHRVTGGAVGEVAGMAFALPAINGNKGGNGDITQSLTTECALNNVACPGAVTADSSGNKTPEGLTFTAGTPAKLEGTFKKAGEYAVMYTVTDTVIADGTYQPAEDADSDDVIFFLEVAQNSAPTLTSLGAIDPGFTTREVSIDLPVAGGGNPVDGVSNVVLTDSLSGMHTDGSNKLKTVMVATGGAISLTDNNNNTTTPTGLMFTQRTGDGAGKEATITGTLAAGTAGTFNLTYTVVDGDRNVKGKCTSANTPVDCDTATVDVTLTVTDPMISLAGGNLPDTDPVVLEKGVDLTAAITLPMVGGNVSAPGNITRVLTSKRTHDVSGNEIGNQTLRAVDKTRCGGAGSDLYGGRRHGQQQDARQVEQHLGRQHDGADGGGHLGVDLHRDGQQRHRQQHRRRFGSQHHLHGSGGDRRHARSGKRPQWGAERQDLQPCDRRCGGRGRDDGIRAAGHHQRRLRSQNGEPDDLQVA